ncbi:GDSL esterase/lipase At1g29670-like [Mangifera indica]|uniref:GDSL esterase/lipase At1g29670-like n=1 Tax=Mangifera indica TaxID=29780 RepID=UPI001CFB4402|nr:GDSL esterase/lipase At1g29670-like [Mangifera indica]
MGCAMKVGWGLINILMVISNLQQCVLGLSKVPCFFIFGDSLSDSGNNNYLATTAKANYSPYGIDFALGPAGRFCNGETRVDIITKILGFNNYIPSFATASTSDIHNGLNYASSGSGILEETGRILGELFSLNQQLQNHKETIKNLVAKLGTVDSATQYLKKCLYSVGMGTNDYVNNYFSIVSSFNMLLYDLEKFTESLIHQYSKQLRILHHLGARKIVLFGLGPLGSTPYTTNAFPVNTTKNMNNGAKLFNKKLKSLVDQLNTELTDAKFIYVNVYQMMSSDVLLSSGFKVLNKSCCTVLNATMACYPFCTPSCENRKEYVYWDGFHPTQAMNRILAQRSYEAVHPSDVHPFDISHLLKL